jgi:hypothetical protein
MLIIGKSDGIVGSSDHDQTNEIRSCGRKDGEMRMESPTEALDGEIKASRGFRRKQKSVARLDGVKVASQFPGEFAVV